jgi:competence protein ComEC
MRFYTFNPIISVLAFSSIFLAGNLCIHVRDILNYKSHLSQTEAEFDHYVIRVQNVVDSSNRYIKCIGDVQRIRNDVSWEIVNGKILLYLPNSAIVDNGDILLIRGKPNRIKPPLNPGEFDSRNS